MVPRNKINHETKMNEVQIDPSAKKPKIVDGKFFSLVKQWSNGKMVANCHFCGKNVCAHIKYTGNLFKHIRLIHPKIINACLIHCTGKASECRTKTYQNSEVADIEEVTIIAFT